MADNIFDAQRDRRIQNLRQQSVSNIIKQNPNLRGVLTRYENAEESRLKLLELQRINNPQITKSQKELLKLRIKKRRGGTSKKDKIKSASEAVKASEKKQKNTIELEIELREQEEKIRKEKLKENLEREKIQELRLQRGLDRRQTLLLATRERTQKQIIEEQKIQQKQRKLNTLQDLEQGRTQLLTDIIRTNQIENRVERQEQRQLLLEDRDRYDRAIDRYEQSRQADIAVNDAQLRDIRERVARDAAELHKALDDTQRLAFEQLAQQRLDNTSQRELEARKIDHQRAVDAERAITDREREQTLQSVLTASKYEQPEHKQPDKKDIGLQFTEDIKTREQLEKVKSGQPIEIEGGSEGSLVSAASSDVPSVSTSRDERFEAASDLSSASSSDTLADPTLQRALDIQDQKRIDEGTPTFTTKKGKVKPKFKEGEREKIKERKAQREAKERGELTPASREEEQLLEELRELSTLQEGQGQVEELEEDDNLYDD